MSLIHASHLHVILFLVIIGYIFFGMYFLNEISPINTFTYTVISPKELPGKWFISYHYATLVLIFEVNAPVFYKSTVDFDG